MIRRGLRWCAVPVVLLCGCTRTRDDLDYDYDVEQTWVIDQTGGTIVQFATVPFRPLSTALLRSELAIGQRLASRRVLELGTGTGFFAIGCVREGASAVVVLATDRVVDACVRYNIALANFDAEIQCRLIEPTTGTISTAIKANEQFDYVVVNSEQTLDPSSLAEVIAGLPQWLRGGGKAWIICETITTKESVIAQCQTLGFDVETLRHSDPVLNRSVDEFPQTLQIDPFTAAAASLRTPAGGAEK